MPKQKLTAKGDDQAIWITKPAPYCLLRNHVEQIKVDPDFHDLFIRIRRELRASAGIMDQTNANSQ